MLLRRVGVAHRFLREETRDLVKKGDSGRLFTLFGHGEANLLYQFEIFPQWHDCRFEAEDLRFLKGNPP